MKKGFLFLIAAILLINIVIAIYNFLYLKERKMQNAQIRTKALDNNREQNDFIFDSLSLEFETFAIGGQRIDLSEMKGKV